jgi:aldose 1-epimerase
LLKLGSKLKKKQSFFIILLFLSCPIYIIKSMKITKEVFGQVPEKGEASLFSITNSNGVILRITNYGGIIQSIIVPDRNGIMDDVVLGFDNLEGYLQDHPYIGTVVGRYANRIAGGQFTLDGEDYILVKNNGGNHLHGGTVGYDKILWEAEDFADKNGAGVSMVYLSHHMEEGYPGNLQIRITYTLDEENRVHIDYEATCDKATHINLTNHSYFNLNGAKENIYNHEMMINSNEYIVSNEDLIPTGEIGSLRGTPLDLINPKLIGDVIGEVDGGFDHCYVLKGDGIEPELAARVSHPASGRVMEAYTTEPGIQFYSSNFLEGLKGKGGVSYEKHLALCLEAQHYPDTPNQQKFPSTLLQPGDTYRQKTIYKFGLE